jgi:hypothetical protein
VELDLDCHDSDVVCVSVRGKNASNVSIDLETGNNMGERLGLTSSPIYAASSVRDSRSDRKRARNRKMS